MNHTHNSFEENNQLYAKIDAILSEKSSKNTKKKKLASLQESVSSSLARSHIAYYYNELKRHQYAAFKRIAVYSLVFLYLLWILYRIYYTVHPEKPHYEIFLNLPEQSIATVLCAIPVCILAYFLFQYVFSQKKYRKYLLLFIIALVAILAIFTAKHLCIEYKSGYSGKKAEISMPLISSAMYISFIAQI